MRRTVILATLTILLFAAAGVTAARETTFIADPRNERPESTSSEESTAPENTVEETVETTVEITIEDTVVEPTQPERPVREETAPDAEDLDKVEPDEAGAGKPAGKPDKPGKPDRSGKVKNSKKHGKPEVVERPGDSGKPTGKGKPESAGKPEKKEPGGKPGKVTLCHKDRVTISVGAPAEPAHLRHGDSLGACG